MCEQGGGRRELLLLRLSSPRHLWLAASGRPADPDAAAVLGRLAWRAARAKTTVPGYHRRWARPSRGPAGLLMGGLPPGRAPGREGTASAHHLPGLGWWREPHSGQRGLQGPWPLVGSRGGCWPVSEAPALPPLELAWVALGSRFATWAGRETEALKHRQGRPRWHGLAVGCTGTCLWQSWASPLRGLRTCPPRGASLCPPRP